MTYAPLTHKLLNMSLTEKQQEVYQYICNYFKNNGLAPTQKEIKEHFSFKSFGSVQRYIKYLVNAGLLDSDWNARRGLKLLEHETNGPDSYTIIPLLGNVAAGNPIEALENPTETIEVPNHMLTRAGPYFALSVKGDSMIEDGILENDIIICQQAEFAQQGQIVVAIWEDEATVKHFYRYSDRVELIPANQNFSPIVITTGNFKIAGILIGLLRSYL